MVKKIKKKFPQFLKNSALLMICLSVLISLLVIPSVASTENLNNNNYYNTPIVFKEDIIDTSSFIIGEYNFSLPDGTLCTGFALSFGEISYSINGQLIDVYSDGWLSPKYRFVTFTSPDLPSDLVAFLDEYTFMLSDLQSYFDQFDHNTKLYFLETYYPDLALGADISSLTVEQLYEGNPDLYDDIIDIGKAKALNALTIDILRVEKPELYDDILAIGGQEALVNLTVETLRTENPQLYDTIINIGESKALNNLTLQIIKDSNINLYNSIVDIGRNEVLSNINVDYIRDNYPDVYNAIADIGRDDALNNLTFAIVLEYAPDVFTEIRDFGMEAALSITPEELQQINPDLYNAIYNIGHTNGIGVGESNAFINGFFGDFFGGVRDSLDSLVLYQSTDSPIPINVTVWGVLSTIVMLFIVIFVLKLIAGG